MASATVSSTAPRNIPAMAYRYDEAARLADGFLRQNSNIANDAGVWVRDFVAFSVVWEASLDGSLPATVGGLQAC